MTVLETAFLPLEDSPIYMSIRNLLPDSSVVLYAPSKPHILVADWIYISDGSRSDNCRLPIIASKAGHSTFAALTFSCICFQSILSDGSRSFIARSAHDFMTSVSQMPGQSCHRSREQAHGSMPVLSCRLPSYLVKPSSD